MVWLWSGEVIWTGEVDRSGKVRLPVVTREFFFFFGLTPLELRFLITAINLNVSIK
jgi:hypothetical protein